MSIAMDRVQSYMFNFPVGNLDQSPVKPSGDLVVDPELENWFFPSDSSSSASSSIGKNSDDEDDGEENEAESPYKGPLDLMESLEEVLPVRKGLSKFYNGKSKSFTSLVEETGSSLTSSTSMKDLVKPENPYSRRRRNLLCHQIWDNNKTNPRGGISKKPIMGSSRSALTLAIAVITGEGSSSGGDSSSPGSSPTTSGSPRLKHRHHQMLPPLYPRSQGSFGNLTTSSPSSGFCAWRSYSVADISRCFPATASDS